MIIPRCNHLKFVKESYLKHLWVAVNLTVHLLVLSVASLIHGLFPFILTSVVSKQIEVLNNRLKEIRRSFHWRSL